LIVSSPYLFAVCQAGAESALKGELASEHPALKLAFSRPGFVTFKAPAPLNSDVELRSVFAREYGLSFGPSGFVESPGDLLRRAAELLPADDELLALHVFEREGPEPNDGEAAAAEPDLPSAVSQALRAAAPSRWSAGGAPVFGQGVVDVVVLEPDAGRKSPLYLGFHRHGPGHSPWPGGRPNLSLPAAAPSRAYLKLEEALQLAKAPIESGDVAVEVGCAPGGAAYALLERGLTVYGVDRAACAPIVMSSARFVAVRKSMDALKAEDLPPDVHWLLFDINAGAFRSVPAAEKLVRRYRSSLLGLVLTLKLARWSKAREIPGIVKEIRSWGFARVRAVQLYHNRQEVLILGLTPRAAGRGPAR
jgi:23S rRNA (cytidine2498-2'-O)-methyltransferase